MSKHGPSDPKFAIGDFLTGIPSQYVEALATEAGREPGQFRLYREVADLIPADRRVKASWSVHRDLRHRPALLQDGLTVRGAAGISGKADIDSRPERLLSVDERASRVRKALEDSAVYAVIEAELSSNRRDRTARKLASKIVSEHANRKKELEAELRQLRETMSPLEATVRAELQISEMTQLLDVISELYSGFENPERIVHAVQDLQLVADRITDRGAPVTGGGDIFRM